MTMTIFLHDISHCSSQISYQHIVIIISTYKKRLIIFKKWFHINFISENFVVVEFDFESNIKNFTTCLECNLTLNNWKLKRNSKKVHMRQSLKCSFVQDLNENETSNSTSTKFASINCIAFSPQIFYLIIIDLYRKQKTLFVKSEKFETVKNAIVVSKTFVFIFMSSSFFIQSKFQLVASSESQTGFDSFKSEKFTTSFSSTSTISDFESIIKSDVALVANSTFFFSYDKRLTTYKNWSHNKFSANDMIATEFYHKLNIKNIVTCSKCDMKLSKWFIDANFLTIHLKARNCSLTQALNDTIIAQKTIEQKAIAARKQSSKIKSRNFFESFKSEKFTINFNSSSISIESKFDIVIRSNVFLVANSIFISISKSSKLNFSRSISFCSTSTILLINQSNRSLVVNIMFFVNYNKRLTTFKKWLYTNSTSETLIQTEFRYTSTKLSLNCITCRRCDVILLDWKSHDDFIKEHLRRSSECFKTKTIKQVAIKTIKSEIINFKNIDFFDSTMQINLWEKFRISINNASFLYHLIEFAIKYKKKSIVKVFSQCFRDSALQWLKNQSIKFTSLSDFKTIMTKIFSSAFEINFDSIIINSLSRFHICSKYVVQFSSTSRLLIHTQMNCSKNFTCKHCEKTFTSNNKFHEHVRLHYIRKNYDNKTLRQRFVEERNNHIDLLNLSTSSTTFKSMTASTKSSHLFISMTKAQVARPIESSVDSPISSMNLAVLAAFKSPHSHRHTCMPSTSSSIPPRSPTSSHQKP